MQQDAAWQRWVPVTGILFVILMFLGAGLMNLPNTDDPDREIRVFYTDSGDRVQAIIGGHILAIAGVVLLVFVNRLRSIIQDAEGGRPLLATGVFGAGIAFGTIFIVSADTFIALPLGLELGNERQAPSAELALILPDLGFTLIVMSMFPAILMILTTTLASFRYSIFPSWFNWLSVVCAIALIFSAVFLPLIALPIWLIAASIVLMRKQLAEPEQS